MVQYAEGRHLHHWTTYFLCGARNVMPLEQCACICCLFLCVCGLWGWHPNVSHFNTYTMVIWIKRFCFFTTLCATEGGDETERKGNLISPLSAWSLVSAAATRCQESWMTGTGGGMVRWHCPQQPSSSPSGHPPTAGWIELRKRRREVEGCQTGTRARSKLETRGRCCR